MKEKSSLRKNFRKGGFKINCLFILVLLIIFLLSMVQKAF